jgi:hypothetical protein
MESKTLKCPVCECEQIKEEVFRSYSEWRSGRGETGTMSESLIYYVCKNCCIMFKKVKE